MQQTNGIPQTIIDRFGADATAKRLDIEDTRELKLGGRVRFCPARQFRKHAEIVFKCLGLWRRGYREYLNPIIRENEFAVSGSDPRLDGFSILHISDLHLDLDPAFPPVLLGKIRAVAGRYDAVAITGDIHNLTVHTDGAALGAMRSLMPAFTAPVYVALGNHDSLRDVPVLEEMGIRVLLNESVALDKKNGAAIRLAGIDDANVFKTHDLAKALPPTAAPRPCSILLTHSPCVYKEAAAAGADIILAGHTHGGQICFPNGRSVIRRANGAHRPVWSGHWRVGESQGWTSYGVGACGLPIRINCPGEIVLHKLRVK